MKVIVIFVTFLVVNHVIGLSIKNNKNDTVLLLERSLNSKLKDFLEYDLRTIMRFGDPVLDPYYQSEQQFQYNDKKLLFKGTFENFNVKNLSQYVVKYSYLNFWTRKIDVDLYFPSIPSKGFYDIDLYYESIPYIGKGQYKATAKDLKIYIEAWISFLWSGFHIKYLNTYLSLGSFDFSGSNKLLDNTNDTIIWNKSISKLIPKIIKDDHDELASYFSKKLIALINKNF